MPDDRIPNLSVVIVTYNNELEITACLASALHAAKDVTCEIIIIDNGSKDGTRNKIAEVISNDQKSRVELVVNTQNLGFTKALNQGLRKSCGEFILALNPDTTLQPASLTILMQTLQEDTKTGLIAPQLLNTDGTVQPSCRRFPRRRDVFFEITGLSLLFPKSRFFNSWKMGDFDHKHRSYVEQPQGACLLFKRQLLTEIGFWDESFPMFFS
ncbi:MAG: glycosyltransferase, partial [bacterium]